MGGQQQKVAPRVHVRSDGAVLLYLRLHGFETSFEQTDDLLELRRFRPRFLDLFDLCRQSTELRAQQSQLRREEGDPVDLLLLSRTLCLQAGHECRAGEDYGYCYGQGGAVLNEKMLQGQQLL
ncbi:hypothetical protein AK812_SmicGene10782 [Symbiodinium microadriaticum]|uniref:Uncharacterized protein n=1 Tax=Symbiodinium microadriaticum TaxID=2951 RepID=A0A1Q9EEY8_SYMMI|nr:hypothetical protein AK812_SmicGene10782 [Symbiodinium microadriaticum]